MSSATDTRALSGKPSGFQELGDPLDTSKTQPGDVVLPTLPVQLSDIANRRVNNPCASKCRFTALNALAASRSSRQLRGTRP